MLLFFGDRVDFFVQRFHVSKGLNQRNRSFGPNSRDTGNIVRRVAGKPHDIDKLCGFNTGGPDGFGVKYAFFHGIQKDDVVGNELF